MIQSDGGDKIIILSHQLPIFFPSRPILQGGSAAGRRLYFGHLDEDDDSSEDADADEYGDDHADDDDNENGDNDDENRSKPRHPATHPRWESSVVRDWESSLQWLNSRWDTVGWLSVQLIFQFFPADFTLVRYLCSRSFTQD